MCCLQFHDEAAGAALAVAAARRGLLFKRSAYNFVSLAHDDAAIDRALDILGEGLEEVGAA
jgi:glutamate-1-semialdehyde aminotransferase